MDTVLVVCTGNICRSPTATGLLADRLAPLADSVSIGSAGVLDLDQPSPPEVVAAGAELGIDLTGHRGRRISRTDILEATLIIGMAREHVREVALLQPTAWPRTFTLKELVRRAQTVGPRDGAQSLDGWLRHVHHGRRTADLLGESVTDDVEDPMGGSVREYRESAGQIASLVDQLVVMAWPTVSSQ